MEQQQSVGWTDGRTDGGEQIHFSYWPPAGGGERSREPLERITTHQITVRNPRRRPDSLLPLTLLFISNDRAPCRHNATFP